MTEVLLALTILMTTLWLFISERVPATVTALIAMSVVTAVGMGGVEAGLIDPAKWVGTADIFASFSSPAVIAIASMFVLSAALEKTGAIDGIARLISFSAKFRVTLLLAIITVAAALSAFINNTAVVATLIPAVMTVCARKGHAPSRFLIPLSYASQFGGVCTIIGTSTNLLGNSLAKKAGLPGFGFFEFAPAGLIMLAAGTLYILVVGRFLLPDRQPERNALAEHHDGEFIVELFMADDCPLIGRPADHPKLISDHDGRLRVLAVNTDGVQRDPQGRLIGAGDRLVALADTRAVETLRHLRGMHFTAGDAPAVAPELKDDPLVLLQAIIAPRSPIAGLTPVDMRRLDRRDAVTLGVRRHTGKPAASDPARKLEFGDMLLLLTRRSRLDSLRDDTALIVLHEKHHRMRTPWRATLAGFVFISVILTAILAQVPIETAALIGAVISVATGCVKLEDAVKSVDWKVLLLLAGMIPMGIVLERSGCAALAVDSMLALTGGHGPIVMLAAIYLMTALLTEFMSNNATAVLLTPVAITAALKIGVDPRPFVVAVLFAASTSFATPVGYQTNAMVYGPGGYRFADFLRVGVPLNLAFWGLAVWSIPKFWPF